MEIQNVCILGAGTLGSRVALQAAISGYQVSIFDITDKALDFSFETMKKILAQLDKGAYLKENQEKILSRVYFTLDPEKAVKDA
ncbi:MAG TPA: 3-hydroxybutyryl-CoA dehydrogenase, partial [Algoriphagus sp.]|nr:3-hydroxybutyryl-CoA dehydrogenase [Algoriphagus sp.]